MTDTTGSRRTSSPGTDPAPRLRRLAPGSIVRGGHQPVDAGTLRAAAEIIADVRARGPAAVRERAEAFGERAPGEPLLLGPAECRAALDGLDREDRAALERARDRIDAFARAQRAAIVDIDHPVPGGRAGHEVRPVEAAGCYAPAGRAPLPSSALMTAVTARAAGCERIVVASPGAPPSVLAAAGLAGADAVLAVGGAHAIAALAFGLGKSGLPPVDVVVGPGNRWVTAAKQLVVGAVGIDMLAGPSELLVLADAGADPATVAADLLAQAEHDVDAAPMLVSTSPDLLDAVDDEIARRLPVLETAGTAAAALANGFACLARDLDEAIEIVDRVAPEHLELLVDDARSVARRVRHAGGVFIGAGAAEVLGDYGAGPNHTLPTGGTARFSAGLSVVHFLRLRTWLQIDDPAAAAGLVADTERLARLEGLPGHAASAARRRTDEAGSLAR